MKCGKCGKPKIALGAWCSSCNKKYQRRHYEENKAAYKKRARDQRMEVRKKMYDFLSTEACVDCGEDRVATLQFDHVSGKKDRCVSKMVRDRCSWGRILKEIDKCEVRCANCHSVRTAEVANWYPWLNDAAVV